MGMQTRAWTPGNVILLAGTTLALAVMGTGGCGSTASWSRTPAYSADYDQAYDLPPRETAPRRNPAPTAPEPGRAGVKAPDSRLADLGSQVEALRERLQQLEGRVGELQHQVGQRPAADPQVEQLRQRLAEVERSVQTLQERPLSQESAGGGSRAAAETSGEAPAPSAPAAVPRHEAVKPVSRPAGDAYQEGLAQYKKKSYAGAVEQFSRYLKEHPQGAKAAEARYYLGDSYYQQKRLDEAIVEFNKVVEGHSKSVLAPTALLKQAYAFKAQGKTKVYTLVLEKLTADYPSSPEAAQAQKLLGGSPKAAVKKKGK